MHTYILGKNTKKALKFYFTTKVQIFEGSASNILRFSLEDLGSLNKVLKL